MGEKPTQLPRIMRKKPPGTPSTWPGYRKTFGASVKEPGPSVARRRAFRHGFRGRVGQNPSGLLAVSPCHWYALSRTGFTLLNHGT